MGYIHDSCRWCTREDARLYLGHIGVPQPEIRDEGDERLHMPASCPTCPRSVNGESDNHSGVKGPLGYRAHICMQLRISSSAEARHAALLSGRQGGKGVLHTEAYFSLMMYMYPSPPEKGERAGERGLRAVCFTPLPFPLPSRARGEGTLGPLSWRIAFRLNNTSCGNLSHQRVLSNKAFPWQRIRIDSLVRIRSAVLPHTRSYTATMPFLSSTLPCEEPHFSFR